MSTKYSTLSSSTIFFFKTNQRSPVMQHQCGLQAMNFYPGALLPSLLPSFHHSPLPWCHLLGIFTVAKFLG